jgi:hypothetical protein
LQRGLVRASRTIVRPDRKNGGTTLILRLSKPTVLRVSIVRVYPSCERLGSFTVRAHAGVNRIRFRGRFRGRALPEGGYRLVIRARGAKRDAAAVPIVIARGKTSKEALRKARNGSTCAEPIAAVGSVSSPRAGGDHQGSSIGVLDRVKEPVLDLVGAVTGSVSGNARALLNGVTDRVAGPLRDRPVDDPLVLTIIGFLLLVIAFLGTMLLAQFVRSLDTGER